MHTIIKCTLTVIKSEQSGEWEDTDNKHRVLQQQWVLMQKVY